MSTPVTMTGPQGAMIYLAESLAGLKYEQQQTNTLLRELIELARAGASNGNAEQQDEEPDEIAQLKSLLVPNPPNGAPAPR